MNMLDDKLASNLRQMDYVDLLPMQKQATSVLLSERSLIMSAPTGSGKTAAYLIPIIEYVIRYRKLSKGYVLPSTNYKWKMLVIDEVDTMIDEHLGLWYDLDRILENIPRNTTKGRQLPEYPYREPDFLKDLDFLVEVINRDLEHHHMRKGGNDFIVTDNQETIKKLKRGEIQGIVSSNKLVRAVDIPEVDHVSYHVVRCSNLGQSLH
ncbi:hypothetical protein KIN20_006403 [Parelaphostrongylus tenuis]|uniref:RNA helicase n=1 Tax=Parelaphostrongylus tenuis TaxID=148309 RepID=A0AAD5MU25_PARTN|nr:hypothetical protein KIN20_006403 [Parelaphostrongylus tenuis]